MTDPDTVLGRIEAKLDQLLALQQPCAACEERKREEAAATEQWKREFMERHGLTQLAEGGLVKNPVPFIESGNIDCVFPVSDSIRAHISPGEAMVPGPNGPLHIRGAYGEQPAQITEIDMDDPEEDE